MIPSLKFLTFHFLKLKLLQITVMIPKAFYRRLYTKKDIVEEALAGRRMPPKSTRHTIPERIIRLNLHLGWLAESPDVCKQMMDDMLKRRLNEGSIRRYTETVIVLY